MSSSALDWVPILRGWFLTRPSVECEIMMPLFEGIFDDVYEFWQISLNKEMSVLQCMIIKQVREQLPTHIKHVILLLT